MMSFMLIAGPVMMMAVAYLMVLHAGFAAGACDDDRRLGVGALGLCILLVLAQAVLWVLWALNAGGVI